MGRKPKNSQPDAGNQTAATDPNDNAATAEAMTMSAFERRADRASYHSIRDAAMYLFADKYEPKNDATVRNAVKKHAAFKTPGALVSVSIEGYEIPPLTYLHIDAINAYRDAMAATGSGAGRGSHRLVGGKKRHIVRLSPEEFTAYTAGDLALTVDRFPLEAASAPHKPKDKDQPANTSPSGDSGSDTPIDAVSSDQPPSDIFAAGSEPEAEPIEA